MTNLKLKKCWSCKTFFNCLALLLLAFSVSNCVKKSSHVSTEVTPFEISKSAVDINSASVKELEKLPNVGATIARKIVEYRKNNGSFRKPEHLILIDGISDRRFREIRTMIKIN